MSISISQDKLATQRDHTVEGHMQLELSAPKVITFVVSVLIALIAAVIHYAHIDVPYMHSGFTLLFVGYLLLAAGNVLRGV